MRLNEILNEYKFNKMENLQGPFLVSSYDADTRTLVVDGLGKLVLTDKIKDEPKPGFNYAFELAGNYVTMLASLTADNVITDGKAILLIKRKNPPFAGYWALPGGFVNPGEKPLDAAKRELAEETGLDLSGVRMRYVGKYSEKYRDPRQENVVTFAYYTQIPRTNVQAGDDASRAEWVDVELLSKINLAFDHKTIVQDALNL